VGKHFRLYEGEAIKQHLDKRHDENHAEGPSVAQDWDKLLDRERAQRREKTQAHGVPALPLPDEAFVIVWIEYVFERKAAYFQP